MSLLPNGSLGGGQPAKCWCLAGVQTPVCMPGAPTRRLPSALQLSANTQPQIFFKIWCANVLRRDDSDRICQGDSGRIMSHQAGELRTIVPVFTPPQPILEEE